MNLNSKNPFYSYEDRRFLGGDDVRKQPVLTMFLTDLLWALFKISFHTDSVAKRLNKI